MKLQSIPILFAALTCSFSDTFQIVNEEQWREFSMKLTRCIIPYRPLEVFLFPKGVPR